MHPSLVERAQLCDLFDELGPDAPTLCEGWRTTELAAHLWTREHRIDAGPGLLGRGPFAGYTARLEAKTARRVPRVIHRALSLPHWTMAKNVLGTDLQTCSNDPTTGFYRDGCCNTGGDDVGVHTVCAVVTDEFLEFSKAAGNDLSTPMPQFGFPGLRDGDQWCLCAPRWQEAFEAGKAPRVVLEATHIQTLEWCTLDDLKAHAVEA